MAQGVAYLGVDDRGDAVVELQAVASDVVEDAAVEGEGGFALVGDDLFCVLHDDAEAGTVQVELAEDVAQAAAMDDDAIPAAGCVVVEEIVEHVVEPVAPEDDGLFDGSLDEQLPTDM